MKSILLRTVALSALMTSQALAADLAVKAPPVQAPVPVSPLYNWSGFYAGLNAGADFAYSGDPSTSASCAVPTGFSFGIFACADVPRVNAAGTGSMHRTGFTGGGQAGYNWQRDALVLGGEVDFGAFSGKASRSGGGTYALNSSATYAVTDTVNAHWLMTARARVGVAFDNVLLFATGGLAVTDLSASNSFSDSLSFATGTWNASSTKTGWTAGAGVEWGVARNWTVKAEYLYVHFDSINASGFVTGNFGAAAYGSAISTSTDLSAHIARAGINYRF
ncbi:MAG: outer membrane beta-barrel protein [Xanthobacteraceae bacterium]|nr:outer membrane beta-barrel protein [Xanthobacteraceae bacterium]